MRVSRRESKAASRPSHPVDIFTELECDTTVLRAFPEAASMLQVLLVPTHFNFLSKKIEAATTDSIR